MPTQLGLLGVLEHAMQNAKFLQVLAQDSRITGFTEQLSVLVRVCKLTVQLGTSTSGPSVAGYPKIAIAAPDGPDDEDGLPECTAMSWVNQAYFICASRAAAPLSVHARAGGSGTEDSKVEVEATLEHDTAERMSMIRVALRRLATMAHQPSIPLYVSSFHIQRICWSLAPHLGEEPLELEWCKCLWALARRHAHFRHAIFHAGGIDGLLQIVRGTISEPGQRPHVVLRHACGAIGSLCVENPWNCVAVREAQGVRAVVLSMHFHPPSAELQADASFALATLALSDPDSRSSIVNADGIERVVGAMRLHPENVKVQLEGLRVLLHVGKGCESKCVRCQEHQSALRRCERIRAAICSCGKEVVRCAATAHPGSEAVQEAATAVMEEVLGRDFVVSNTWALPGVDSPWPF